MTTASSWKRLKIEDLIESGSILQIQDGNHGEMHPTSKDYIDSGNRIPFVMANDLSGNKLDLENCKYLPKEHADRLRIGFAKTGDILLTHKGTVGSVAVVPKMKFPYIMLTPQVTYYRVNQDELDPQYLSLYFRSPAFQSMLKTWSAQSTRPYVGITAQKKLDLDLPSFAVQRKISSVLSSYDDLIENNEKRIKVLEEMAQRLYTEWFVHFRFPGHEKIKMVDSGTEYGMIPEDWEVKRLDEISREKRDIVNPRKLHSETPYVGLEHIPRKSITLKDWGNAVDINSSKLAFTTGDILFGKIRPYFHKVVVAPINGIASSDAIVIIPTEEMYRYLLLLCVSRDDFITYATNASQGTKMPRSEWKALIKYELLVPDKSILSRFNLGISSSICVMTDLMLQNRNLIQVRDLLIPQLVTGKRIL